MKELTQDAIQENVETKKRGRYRSHPRCYQKDIIEIFIGQIFNHKLLIRERTPHKSNKLKKTRI